MRTVAASRLTRPNVIESPVKSPGTDRIGDQGAGEGAGPQFVEPAIPGRGFHVFKALRRNFRAVAACVGDKRKVSAAMLPSDVIRSSSKPAQTGAEVPAALLNKLSIRSAVETGLAAAASAVRKPIPIPGADLTFSKRCPEISGRLAAESPRDAPSRAGRQSASAAVSDVCRNPGAESMFSGLCT